MKLKQAISNTSGPVCGFFSVRAQRFLDNPIVEKIKENPFPMQCLLVLLYRLILDFNYVTLLSPLYAYAGFTINLIALKYVFSWVMLLPMLPLLVGLQQQKRPSSILVTLLNYIYFIPLTSYIGCKGSDLWFYLAAMVYWAVFILLQLYVPSPVLKKLSAHHTHLLFIFLTVVCILVVMGISGYYTGFHMQFDFINVYDTRAKAAAYQMPIILRYLLSSMTILLSMTILYWLEKKNYWLVSVLTVVYFFYFSIGAHKAVFFFFFLMLGCYWLYRNWMYRWLAGILFFGVLALWGLGKTISITPMSLFVRRFLYIPVQLSEIYCEFFTQNPVSLLRDTILNKISFDPLYSDGIATIIGEYEGTLSNANNGMLGDLFVHFPVWVGVWLMPLILVLCFRLLDLSGQRLPSKMLFPMCVFFASVFINSSWSTVLLTHGFLLTCLLIYIFPSKEFHHEVL